MEFQEVQLSGITFMLAEAILREMGTKVTHHSVTRNFRDHASGSDAQADAITVNNGSLRKWKRNNRQTVNQNVLRRLDQSFDRQAHGAVARAQNVDAIDLGRINNTDSPPDFRVRDEFAIDFLT
jgi:hypothetical protein